MTNTANTLIHWMVGEMSTMTYGYRDIVEACYETAVMYRGFHAPTESKEVIVDKVIEILNDEGIFNGH